MKSGLGIININKSYYNIELYWLFSFIQLDYLQAHWKTTSKSAGKLASIRILIIFLMGS